MLKRFMKNLSLYLLPFALALVFFFAFETCDYFCVKGNARYESRSIFAARELLIKRPENIILGDSRMANINSGYVRELTGEYWCVLAYGGATLTDSINQFWFAAENTELKNVVIGVDFYRLNAGNATDSFVSMFLEPATNLKTYLTGFDYWARAFNAARVDTVNFFSRLRGNGEKIHVDDPSSLTQSDPVQSMLYKDGYRADLYDYSDNIINQTIPFGDPEGYLSRLEEIAAYCGENGINLTFIIPNCNRAIWERVIYAYNLEPLIAEYKDRLKSAATVYDFEFDNAFAREDGYFIDGFHFIRTEKMRFTRVIFAGEPDDGCVVTTRDEYLKGK